MSKPAQADIAAFPIAVLFLYTGLEKLYHLQNFRLQLHLSPWHFLSLFSTPVAWVLPLIELSVSVMLLWPTSRKIGLITSAVLFALFIFYIALLMSSGKKLPCSCGGIVSYLSWKSHLFLNVFFLLLTFLGLYTDRRQERFAGQV